MDLIQKIIDNIDDVEFCILCENDFYNMRVMHKNTCIIKLSICQFNATCITELLKYQVINYMKLILPEYEQFIENENFNVLENSKINHLDFIYREFIYHEQRWPLLASPLKIEKLKTKNNHIAITKEDQKFIDYLAQLKNVSIIIVEFDSENFDNLEKILDISEWKIKEKYIIKYN